ncbi:Ankyrin and HET domain protein [Metarhizium acridum CQMa 102]|uniref:Ankyrin and HET domain protein n=1 Tax=Metarhizium acridum (strain CQMa 102) TaxID=655827 RepID=E9EFP3_METAQ|nr:Ankyrin and HET domain protein [Metarhizium acridum CQMa 102]EFY85281.1 Ankyrin and HET domain protein [Metarhizium acridum CQMa 102]
MNLGEWANKAMDPRDRIFAVLSFASDSNELRILPAYTTSCAHVYLQAATEILSRSLTLDIFYAVSSSKNVQGLPSWVPDWSSPNASTFGPRRIGKACAAGILNSSILGGICLLSAATATHWTSCGTCKLLEEATGNACCSEGECLEALWKTPIADCDAYPKPGSTVRPSASETMKRFEALLEQGQTGCTKDDVSASRPFLHIMNLESARRRMFPPVNSVALSVVEFKPPASARPESLWNFRVQKANFRPGVTGVVAVRRRDSHETHNRVSLRIGRIAVF